MPDLTFTLNGVTTTVAYEDGMSLLEVLRTSCGITSPKDGCSGEGVCGCCTVLVDGTATLACQVRPEKVEGKRVTTLEGLTEAERAMLARAFVQEGAVQCGFCTPGIVMRTKSLLDRGKARDRDAVARALGLHLCRCTGYLRVFDAVLTAGEAGEHGGAFARETPRRDDYFGSRYGRLRARHHEGCCGSHARGVGTPARRYRGEAQALGEKPFVADLSLPGMLHGAVVLAEHPRSRVLAIDPAAALALPGVVRVLTAADIPGQRMVGPVVHDQPAMVGVGELTRCVGDVLALVVAETRAKARRAAAAVRVTVEVLEPVTSPEQALAAGAPALHPSGNLLEVCAFARGSVAEGLAAAAHVVEARFQTQRVEHAFLEPEACVAVPEQDTLKVYSQGQGVHDDQEQIAAMLGLPLDAVEVELLTSGGGFGGKEDLSVQGHAALAAWLLGRPVKVELTRAQSIRLHPKRHPLTLDYVAGCDAAGRLVAVKARIVGDTGAYASVGAKVLERAAGHSCGPYRVPNVDVEARTVYTNNPPSGAMRGFGASQAAFAIEGVMDMLAEKAGIDRYDIRERNVLRPGDRFATGQLMNEGCGILETLEAVRDVFKTARHAGIACGIKNTGLGNGMEDIGRVLVRVMPSGQLEVLTGYTEMGQGLHSVLRQVLAEETGVDPERMEVFTRSDPRVVCGMTTASRAAALLSEAGRRAGRKLKEALDERAASESLEQRLQHLAGTELLGEFICAITTRPGAAVENPVTHMSFGYATQVVILDDEGRIARVVAAHDVGHALNPLHCVQQIEGSIHMGLGYALSEELRVEGGHVVSTTMRSLGLVPARDMPEVDVILVEVPDPVGGYGSKGVGEIGLVPTAAAVASALAAYDGIRRTRLPMRDAPAARGWVR